MSSLSPDDRTSGPEVELLDGDLADEALDRAAGGLGADQRGAARPCAYSRGAARPCAYSAGGQDRS